MKILYDSWGSVCDGDLLPALREAGQEVRKVSIPYSDYNRDEQFGQKLAEEIRKFGADVVLSFNYFPIISNVCEKEKIIYASWVYDSPHLTLYSKTVKNSCNRIFLFDHGLYEERKQSVPSGKWFYLPLAAHMPDAGKSINSAEPTEPEVAEKAGYEVSFVGSLYTENNFYDQIAYLPDYLKGYLEGLMEAQLKIYGYYFLRQAITAEMCKQLKQYIQFDLGEDYQIRDVDLICDLFLSRKVASMERGRLLKKVAEQAPLALFTGSQTETWKAGLSKKGQEKLFLGGYVDYQEKMPEIFRNSRINLNFSLRTIQTGMPLRVLDILGAGGFLLTNYQEELFSYFEEGTDFVCFEDEADLCAKTAYYLKHEEERKRIAENGCRKARENFSYRGQVEKLIKELVRV